MSGNQYTIQHDNILGFNDTTGTTVSVSTTQNLDFSAYIGCYVSVTPCDGDVFYRLSTSGATTVTTANGKKITNGYTETFRIDTYNRMAVIASAGTVRIVWYPSSQR